MNRNKNFNCDNDKCAHSHGEVWLYPLGGGANLILCRTCWEVENKYRGRREISHPGEFPKQDWNTAKVYSP